MADPLSQLRQFHINGKDIKEQNGYIIFGDHGWPREVPTNYMVYKSEDDKNNKEYYTLECLLYFLKNMDVAHTHYVKQAGHYNMPVVHRPDRKNILAYLKGEQQTCASIDKNAPIPGLRKSLAEIIQKDQRSAGDTRPSTSSQSSTHQTQNDSSREGDNSTSNSRKRPYDPEMEKKCREELAARLYGPMIKKPATIIPTENVDVSGEPSEGSAAMSKLGPEKLAALRAKHLAVKRTTIVDADTDLGKTGSGATDSSSKADILIAMDSDSSKLIKGKEKVWRTRTSILQSQSKNFSRTVVPLINLLLKMEDPNRKLQPPSDHVDHHLNPYQQQQQQQSIQRNAYNRYDQERFVKLDIGVEIDTKKSFVSGVANGLPTYNQSQPATNRQPATNPNPLVNPITRAPADNVDSRHLKPTRLTKKPSYMPIIIIPATTTSLINMYNASAILQDLTYSDGKPNRPRESELLIQRKKPDGTHSFYKIMDNPIKLDSTDWNRVVAVFVQGPAWQFKGWPWGGSPVEIFSHIKGFHLKWDEAKLDDNVAKWNVDILELSRTKRHMDKANLLKFWSSLDNFMTKCKPFLKI